ncbi:MAG: hypothetical protein GY771_05370 [bacterium]|nr:hypothetical protein [bacterium]
MDDTTATVTDKTGDVHEAPERPEHIDAIPEGAAVGAEGYDQERDEAEAQPGLLQQLLDLFKPVDKPTAATETPENEFTAIADAQQQALDAMRYLLSTALKVVDVPSRWVKFPRLAIGTTATRIAGYQPNRKRLSIKTSVANIYLGEGPDVSADSGYLLATTDAPIDISTQDEIWAIGAGDAILYMIGEHYA